MAGEGKQTQVRTTLDNNKMIHFIQGVFFTANSTEETISRNSGILSVMGSVSSIVGNAIAYYMFSGLTSIDKKTRVTIVGIFSCSAIAGCLLFILFLPRKYIKC